ncbi:heavy-metal-associated domain-containing protein [Pseudobacteriovorax antillogorgiicola]|uniref:Copper chaperone n=1 Tax=Pseudobacteriovorax antillogorgiicola TaxID=1513793 RepID=A0A1Y6CJ52_9BACT|nr:heavy metal-associated domain-containing protein [Pseudobacteriovorax antillogorgiicola]TCS47966.1 copper chaperone [Pseudobacteriovorax antillogorgiicola]SMF58205.1 copper chaperone [Pseudobacteriovorax antillogorgiicola]
MTEVKLKIDGMTCEGCVKSIQKAFSHEPKVEQVSINLAEGTGTFKTNLDAATIIMMIEDQGFDARTI